MNEYKFTADVGSRRNGKSLYEATVFLESVKQGRDSIYIGRDYVVINATKYNKMINEKTDMRHALRIAFSLKCRFPECRANSEQVNHSYCKKHSDILAALNSDKDMA